MLNILIPFLFTLDLDCNFPADVESFLNINEKGWTLLKEDDLTKDWTNSISKEKCPVLVSGDFNGDKKMDYCGLFKKSGKYKLIIIESYRKSYSIRYTEEIGYGIYDSGLGVGLQISDKGKITTVDEKDIQINNEYIEVIKFESSTHILYWENGNYHEEYTGD